MASPSADVFHALARSSPWRWSTLRFSVRYTRSAHQRDAVRAWVRRPHTLRVETLERQLLAVGVQPGSGVTLLGTAGGGRATPVVEQPRWRADGLVASRDRRSRFGHDAPFFRDYHWVAVLDPVELADGADRDDESVVPGTEVVGEVREVVHAGRTAWEAELVTTAAYDPRCSCCPLLAAWDLDVLERGAAASPFGSFPRAHLVRLDVRTGVCVRTEEIDGDDPGAGHDLRIEAVDEPMPNRLFTA